MEVIAEQSVSGGGGGGIRRAVGGMLASAAEHRQQVRMQQASREEKLPMAAREGASKIRLAEMDVDAAQNDVGRVAAAVLLGEAEDTDLRAAQRVLREARDDLAAWDLAARYIDEARGVIRDSSGNIISARAL